MNKLKLKLFYNRYIFSIYKNLIYRSAIGCTIFLVNPSNKFDSFPTLEHATYNWPWENYRADALDGKHVNNIIENTISSFEINALYPLVDYETINQHIPTYIQTISPSQINTLHSLLRYANYILFSDIHSISSSQIDTLYPLFRYTNYTLFTEIHISSFQ